jgi:hypothetical protein
MLLQEFISTVYTLAIAGKWGELTEYFGIIRELLTRPRAVITPGKPQDKELPA